MKKIFIDGKAGTTGLRIYERLSERSDIELMLIPEELRKDTGTRKEMLNSCDIAFLCLPDAAAMESVSLIENPDVKVLDTSTAHRTNPAWAYGFPELSEAHREKILNSNRIAVPGCHASGFISLVYPLIEKGVISPETLLACHSLTGYSGGGNKMIGEYEADELPDGYGSPRQYGLAQTHKHLPEMTAITGIKNAPAFTPIVANYYSGMLVTVPLFKEQINGANFEEIRKIYSKNTADLWYNISLTSARAVSSAQISYPTTIQWKSLSRVMRTEFCLWHVTIISARVLRVLKSRI